MTSHDVVNRVRRITGERRVGHAGTLDPFATGLLMVCIGPATRLSNKMMDSSKQYLARVSFGVKTDTDDLTGSVVESSEVPDLVFDEQYAKEVLGAFTGQIEQLPPQYSAKKIAGKKAYDLARSGEHADVKPQQVTIYECALAAIGSSKAGFSATLPYWDVAFTVSKGTYIRSLARDIGERIGCGAHLSMLRRTSTCGISVDDAISLDRLEREFDPANLEALSLDPCSVLGLPVYHASEADMERVRNGASIRLDSRSAATLTDCEMVSVVAKGRLYAVYKRSGSAPWGAGGKYILESDLVIPGGVCGAR